MMTQFPRGFAKRLPAIRQKWFEIGASTAPVERAEIEESLAKVYAQGGLKPPSVVFIVRSPREAIYSLALLRSSSAEIKKLLRAQLRDQLRAQLSDQLSAQLRDQLSAQLSDQLRAQLSAQLRAQLSAQLRDQLRAQLRDQLRTPLSDQLRAIVGDYRYWWWDFGQFDAWWLSYYAGARELGLDTTKLNAVMDYTAVAGWTILFPEIAIVSERPSVIKFDSQGRLHNEAGPAVGYSDGFGVYAIHGVRVPSDIIEEPHKITVARIEAEENAEIRRVMIERYGGLETMPACMAKYLRDAGAEEVHRDLDPMGRERVLYRKQPPRGVGDPILMVKVVNSTAEADGSFKEYFLPVHHELRPLPDPNIPLAEMRAWWAANPPQSLTAHNAVASTWGLRGEDYAPAVES